MHRLPYRPDVYKLWSIDWAWYRCNSQSMCSSTSTKENFPWEIMCGCIDTAQKVHYLMMPYKEIWIGNTSVFGLFAVFVGCVWLEWECEVPWMEAFSGASPCLPASPRQHGCRGPVGRWSAGSPRYGLIHDSDGFSTVFPRWLGLAF